MSKRRSPATHSHTPYRDKYRLFYGSPTMTDTAQEQDAPQLEDIERAMIVLRQEGYPDLSDAVQDRILEDSARYRRLRAPQREEEREPEPNVIPNTDLIREWIEEYEHFSTEGGPDYYPDLAAFIHDQVARRATAIRLNVQPAEPPAEREPRDDEWPNVPYERQVP